MSTLIRMTKLETPILERYWRRATGGTLILEFPFVDGTEQSRTRRADGLILPDAPVRMVRWTQYRTEEGTTIEEVVQGANIVVVQVKPHRLDLPLLGQTFFAVKLLQRFQPASIRGVALCTENDFALWEVFTTFPSMEVALDEP